MKKLDNIDKTIIGVSFLLAIAKANSVTNIIYSNHFWKTFEGVNLWFRTFISYFLLLIIIFYVIRIIIHKIKIGRSY